MHVKVKHSITYGTWLSAYSLCLLPRSTGLVSRRRTGGQTDRQTDRRPEEGKGTERSVRIPLTALQQSTQLCGGSLVIGSRGIHVTYGTRQTPSLSLLSLRPLLSSTYAHIPSFLQLLLLWFSPRFSPPVPSPGLYLQPNP